MPKTGGIAESKKIGDLADTYYCALTPHNIGSPVATMAGVHVGSTVPNFLALEFHCRDVTWWDDLVDRSEPLIQDGRIAVPDEPGLGIELDWESSTTTGSNAASVRLVGAHILCVFVVEPR
ncbi:enolase C-terminal domain-like protein [Salinadaptatus halalkaliphilus]|uniref:enolase C-terminal domain-like protein n=1 Tax=Salinadaptatus halalkaliphilus TaxID=2419781 RepID=UPI001FE39949|nr:enolase C-terminal domain-like protein [Salinadaptatus halalkaliphilus]